MLFRSWVEEELVSETNITTGEAAIVNQFENVDKILESFTARFGPEKGALAREILLAQAHIGIYKRTAEKHQDDQMRQAAESQVADLRVRMNEARKKLGAYCMLYLRNIFPEDASPLWGRLESIIQLKGAAAKEQAGTGLWTTLTQRVAESGPRTEEVT